MGIKHFFSWFKQRFSRAIYDLSPGETFNQIRVEEGRYVKLPVSTLLVDMNGIFHTYTQKIFKYGKHEEKRLNRTVKPVPVNAHTCRQVYEGVMKHVEFLISTVNPSKKVVLCIDGPAPKGKQNQQRQRRFVSALSRKENVLFDSASITPGTVFLHQLSAYMDAYIKRELSEHNSEFMLSEAKAMSAFFDTVPCESSGAGRARTFFGKDIDLGERLNNTVKTPVKTSVWQNLEVVFSNEKVAGEGEHKCINFVRKFHRKGETYCICGADADLIMLALGTHVPEFYVLREDSYYPDNHYIVDIGKVRTEMFKELAWDDSKLSRKRTVISTINDFILMCFAVGNDFLPQIPGLEIIEGGIEMMMDVYKQTCSVYGHLTKQTKHGPFIARKAFSVFLRSIGRNERDILSHKANHRREYLPDPMLDRNTETGNGYSTVNIETYKKEYYTTHFENFDSENLENLKSLCACYLQGMKWVLLYYTKGVPNWNWYYPYLYAPFCSDLGRYTSTLTGDVWVMDTPTLPFLQLLSVLSPKSAGLLPVELQGILTGEMKDYCPETFPIDTSGKKREYEGIAILPIPSPDYVRGLYDRVKSTVNERDHKRNIFGKAFVYEKTQPFTVKSFLGDFTSTYKGKVVNF